MKKWLMILLGFTISLMACEPNFIEIEGKCYMEYDTYKKIGYCKDMGYAYLDGLCYRIGDPKERFLKTLKTMEGKRYPIDGYFVHYGKGAFEWAYIKNDGSLIAKLEGVDSKGYFRYIRVDPKEAGVKIERINDNVTIERSNNG